MGHTIKADATLMASDPREASAAAKTFENQGFDGLISFEGPHDPFLPLALAAAGTEKIELMTGVAIAFARNPMTCAQLANDLQLGSGWPGCLLRREGKLTETVSSGLAGTAMTALMAKFENITKGRGAFACQLRTLRVLLDPRHRRTCSALKSPACSVVRTKWSDRSAVERSMLAALSLSLA